MAEQEIHDPEEAEKVRRFTRHLLRDVQALEELLEGDMIESGKHRIGAEQELCLVDRNWRPAPVNTRILEEVEDPRVVPELGRFNLEINTEPLDFGGDCLSRLHTQLEEVLDTIHRTAREHGAEVMLTGILPTIRMSDLTAENMTPKDRYRFLNRVLTRMRGGNFDFHIQGADELHVEHDSMMVEAANTSFQIHLQVAPDEFPALYNAAQAVAGPVLAAGANSPLLLGKRLWHETRVALLQQSIDTRRGMPDVREIRPRVTFGQQWIEESVLEIYREDIARFRSLWDLEIEEDPFEKIAAGEVPRLEALQLHNGTIYRWNRACYGVTSPEKAHLRVEFRCLPSGPTPLDEIANAAFCYGLMSGISEVHGDIADEMDFSVARGNFIAAAQLGLGAQLAWIEGESRPASELILERLLPLARDGLRESGVDEDDVERYLSVVHDRVEEGQNGARWFLDSLAGLGEESPLEEKLRAVTGAAVTRQQSGEPVHRWDLARLEEGGGWQPSYLRLEGFMDTDLVTVNRDDPVELVANLMAWHRVRYVPVEDDAHRIVGLVSNRALLRYISGDEEERTSGEEAAGEGSDGESPTPVEAVMVDELVTASPDMPTLDAIELMRREGVGCLPVVKEGRLVGIVTERNFLDVAGQLLERRLRQTEEE